VSRRKLFSYWNVARCEDSPVGNRSSVCDYNSSSIVHEPVRLDVVYVSYTRRYPQEGEDHLDSDVRHQEWRRVLQADPPISIVPN